MMSKKWFWVVMSIMAIIGIVLSVALFDNAFPIVNVPITMNRNMAIQKADSVGMSVYNMPSDMKKTAMFGSDNMFKNYVELDGGGAEALQEVINSRIYFPYTWQVRQFSPGRVTEATYTFSPDGKFYDLAITLPDSLPGPDLSKKDIIIEEYAAKYASIFPDLSGYELVEHSTELKSAGRRDHVLTYEMKTGNIEESAFRIDIGISGDKLTMINHYVRIPETFKNNYKEMRSVNSTIAMTGELVMIILYGLLGVGGAFFFMLKKRTLEWRGPLTWGIIITVLLITAQMTSLPLAWFGYDTSLSAGQFVFQHFISALMLGLLMGVIFFLSSAAGEGLGRHAFPNHIRLWKAWSPELGASQPVMRQTIFGYLWALFMVGFITLFYWFSNHVLGWWSPADNLVNPNILALPLPWLQPAAMSTQAGFWEETLFRAVPLAGAVLIGQRFKKKKLWIALALIVQAVIFGAMHANYAQQPAYARIVEMLIPFIIYGLIYINWGLLPVVISHFVYDIILMEMPLFLVSAPGIWLNRLLAVIFALIPLIVVLVLRKRHGKIHKVNAKDLNLGYVPKPELKKKKTEVPADLQMRSIRTSPFVLIAVMAVAGLALWLGFEHFNPDQPKIEISREKAAVLADAYASMNVPDSTMKNFNRYIQLKNVSKSQRQFVWDVSDADNYYHIFTDIIPAVYYSVDYKMFRGDMTRRAETVNVRIDHLGRVCGWDHKFPEDRPGADLSEDVARNIAENMLLDYSGIMASKLDPVSVTPKKLDDRTDWNFVYRDTTFNLGGGYIHYEVHLAGDQVSKLNTKVFRPEKWVRAQKKANVLKTVFSSVSAFLTVAVMITVLILGILAWTRNNISVKALIILIAVILAANTGQNLLNLDTVMAGLPTTVVFQNIIVMIILSLGLGTIIMSLLYGISGAYLVKAVHMEKTRRGRTVITGICGGLIMSGIVAFADSSLILDKPFMLNFDAAASAMPVLSYSLESLMSFIQQMIVLAAIAFITDLLTMRWTRRKALGIVILLLSGFRMATATNPASWVLTGMLIGAMYIILYLFVIRQNYENIPWIIATMLIADRITVMLVSPVTGSATAAAVGSLTIIGVAICIHALLNRAKKEQVAG